MVMEGGRRRCIKEKAFDLPQWFHVFFATLSNFYVQAIMNHQGHNNIRNGIVKVQTSHSTCTCTASLYVIEPRTHQKYESSDKIITASTKIEFESAI